MLQKWLYISALVILVSQRTLSAAENVIEKQLQDIGAIPNEEVVVVQRKYTRKIMRHEFTPIAVGGIPFGTVRRTLMGGASYSLHVNDWFAWEAVNFAYSKTFFSSFTEDINNNKIDVDNDGTTDDQANIKPDFQKLLYFLTTGVQFTPFYGKVSTFSRWIAYVEPYFTLGGGIAKTEVATYLTFYPGVGIRAFFREWFSMKLEFRDYIYTEKFNTRTAPSIEDTALRNNYAVVLSISFWLPKMP